MEQFIGIYTEEERTIKIKREHTRLRKILKGLDRESQLTVERLIQEAAFMAVTLEEARQIIARDGIIETYQNGQNQCGQKKSSAVEVYDKLMNTYAKVVKQICDNLPEKATSDPAEEILGFVTRGTG